MKTPLNTRPLDRLLYAALFAEFTTWCILFFSPHETFGPEDNSQFAHVWDRLFWVLTGYWFFTLVLAALNHRSAHIHYGAGWLAFSLYGFLGRQDLERSSAIGSISGDLNTFLGGACFTLLVFRRHQIGCWLQQPAFGFLSTKFRKSAPSAEEAPPA